MEEMKKEGIYFMKDNEQLLTFLDAATSPFHAVLESKAFLKENNFSELNFGTAWNLEKGGRYYTTIHDSTLFAFHVGENIDDTVTFRIAAAHTDFPCFRIKPNAEYPEKDYLRVNAEIYGGLPRSYWMDRPLSIAGKIALKSNSIFNPEIRIIDFRRPLLTIPSLAIHMNRNTNKGIELNPQTDLLPLIGMIQDELNKDTYFLDFLSQELNVDNDEILDFDLYVYNQEKGCMLGMKEEFISSPRLDNMTSVLSCLNGIISKGNEKNIQMIALYDNEEIGSKTKQGADSMITNALMEKIFHSLSLPPTQFSDSIYNSFMISIDVAHGYHPNNSSKNDPTNITQLNHGIILKLNTSQKYATDTNATASIQQLCQSYQIPYQKYVNRSDMAGGSTLGSLTSSWLPMKTVDLGVPLLAMHSARELMGANDMASLNHLVVAFFDA